VALRVSMVGPWYFLPSPTQQSHLGPGQHLREAAGRQQSCPRGDAGSTGRAFSAHADAQSTLGAATQGPVSSLFAGLVQQVADPRD